MDSSSSASPVTAAAAAAPAATDRYTFSPRLRWQPEVEEYFVSAYGRDHFARISQALARPSCYSCVRVNTLKSSTDAVMQKLLNLVNQNELCGGMNGLEIGEQNGGEQAHEGSYQVHKCPYSGLENVLFVRGSGPHVLHCDGEPGQPIKEIIVSRKCAESVLRGAQDLWVVLLGPYRSPFFSRASPGGTNQAAAACCNDSSMLHFSEHCKQKHNLYALMPHALT